MKFLESPPRFLFFTGKGGVGKTSLACATAYYLADNGKRVLLVSTDPASNVGQVFDVVIGNTITAIKAVKNLYALEIDPQEAAQAYRDKIVNPAREASLPESVIKSIEEQLSGACTTEIAAFDQFTDLLTDGTLTRQYDHIVFDTAPTGHTIRLLQLPGAWSDFLEQGKGDASCLGPLAGLEKHRSQYKAAVDSLADANRTRLVLVARAQTATLREAARTQEELAAIGLNRQYLVVNGILPPEEADYDDLSEAIHERENEALSKIPEQLRSLPCDHIPLQPVNLVGLKALRNLLVGARQVVEDDIKDNIEFNFDGHALSRLVDDIESDGRGLVMVMGKGGVGKTTIAAAIAVELAARNYSVHLTTSDPAAHLSETLSGSLDNLVVSQIDPKTEIERYRQHVLETKGAKLDEHGRALLEEDLRSPCTEEIAVFQAFSRVIREASEKFVIMDTAPTGHTLLLLDATGSYHREITRQIGEGVKLVTPLMQLQDPKCTKVLIATLAETIPVLEAATLQEDLRRAGIEPWAWVINNSIAAAHPRSSLLKRRALDELCEIDIIAKNYAKRYAIVPMQKKETYGSDRLRSLVT